MRLGRRSLGVRADLGQPDDVLAMMDAADREFGRVEILVNNVGIGHRARPEALSLEDWRKVVAVNLDGTFLATREAGRRMIARGAGGSIVSISSIAGSSALGRGNFVYSVTKAGIIQLTRELAVEWAPHRIRVNAIQPAQVMTKAMDRMLADPRLDPATLKERFLRGIPLDRIGEPEDIAKAAALPRLRRGGLHHRPQPAGRRRQPRAQRGRQQALAHGPLTRRRREDLDGHSERDRFRT